MNNNTKIKAKVLREVRDSYKDNVAYNKLSRRDKQTAMEFYESEIVEFVFDAIDFTLDAVELELKSKKK